MAMCAAAAAAFTPLHSSIRRRIVAADEQRECVLAIDVGTGGTKACLVSSSGNVLVSGFSYHSAPVQSPLGGPLSMEQDQEHWWLATVQAVQSCILSPKFGMDRSSIRGIAVTGQMQDIILVPKSRTSFRSNAILYCDTRAAAEVDEIAELVGGAINLAKGAGGFQGASSVLAKLRWIDKHMEDAARNCAYLLFGGHDYVVWRLCGSPVTDITTASTTGLTNSSFQYAYDLINKVGLEHWIDKFPHIFPADVPCGEVTSWAAKELGCPCLEGLPVLHCCGDAGTCTLGAGAADPGYSYAYLGTSGWVAGSFPIHASDGEFKSGVFTLGHPNSSLMFKTGSIMTAGGNLSWAAETLTGGKSFEEINRLAASSCAGCRGLLYLPFINGERCPIDNPNFRAAFIGISTTTSQADMLRAVMEGVAFAMRSAHEAMTGQQVDDIVTKTTPLRLVGGGARSVLWPIIMSAVFDQEVEVLANAQDVGVKGAAILAGRWLGWHSSLCPGGHWLEVEATYEPSSVNIDAYRKLYLAYMEASQSLQHVFEKLTSTK